MIDIQDILCVLEVAKQKKITKAAENLFLTQSAVSQKIARTEKSLGLTLFERSNRSVELTKEGVSFVEHASHMIKEWESFLSKMEQLSGKDTHFLTVGMHALAIYSNLPALIANFTASHPNWKVNLSTHDDNFKKILSKETDFFFIFTNAIPHLDNDALFEIPLMEDTLYILLHKTDSLSSEAYIEEKKLRGYHLISWYTDLIHSFPKELELTLTVCEDSFLPSMITKAGMFTMTPKSRCEKILQHYPDLCAVPFQFSGSFPALTLYLVYNSDRIDAEKHPFVQFVVNYYQKLKLTAK